MSTNDLRAATATLACPHAARCGGCTRIDEPYSAQLERKRARLARALARFPALREVTAPRVAPASVTEGYRTRAKLVVAPGPRVGLFARDADHEVLDLPGCPVLAPAVRAAVDALRGIITRDAGRDPALEPHDGAARRGALRGLDVREVRPPTGPAGVLVTLVLDQRAQRLGPALEATAQRLLREVPGALAIAASMHDGRTPMLLGGAPRPLAGAALARDEVRGARGLYVLATPGGFVQAHRDTAAALQRALVAWADRAAPTPGRGARVLELFAGAGALGLRLAAAGHAVCSVESFEPAVRLARDAARAQRLSGLDARADDATAACEALAASRERFDAAALNPPRRGLEPALREALAALGPAHLAYVSCEPETLARDLAHLLRRGYALDALAAFDMFPQTDEVETLATLRRVDPPSAARPAVLARGPGWCALAVEPFDGEARCLAAARVSLAGDAAPARPLEHGASGLALYRTREAAAHLEARGAGSFVALVRGVTHKRGAIERPSSRARRARTKYTRLAVLAGHSLVRAVSSPDDALVVREHFAAIGHPVLGDEALGHAPSNRHVGERYGLERVFLHRSAALASDDPRAAAEPASPWVVRCPLAADLRSVLARMGFEGALDDDAIPSTEEPAP